jgi:hypothetical protein
MSEGCPAATCMSKDATPAVESSSPPLSLEKPGKGSHRSMWELLLQLRVLLPYLARLVPLLDPKASTRGEDLSEITTRMVALQTGSRDLEVQARNQALQLERMEQQMGRLRVVHESSIEENRILSAEVRSLRRWLMVMAGVMVVLLLVTAGMVGFLLFRSR